MQHGAKEHDPRGRPVVVVTGSSGLIGAPLMDRLKSRYQVVGFDRDGSPQPPPEIECVCVDLTDRKSVELGVARVVYAYGRRLAAVVHLAAFYDFSGEPSPLYEQVNVRGTERLLEALQGAGCSLGVFAYSSTMLVHAPTEPGRPIDEDAPIEAKWDYPRSKVAAERRVAELRGHTPVVMLRIAGVYSDRCDSIPLSQQIHRIDHKSLDSRLYPGDPTHGQSFVHLDDVLDALERVVDQRDRLPDAATPLLIAEPETFGYGELQQRLGKLLHGVDEWPLHHVPKTVAKAGAWLQDKLPMQQFIKPWMVDIADDHYEVDVRRAESLLGWQPRHRVVDVLPAMIADLRNDPEGWRRRHGFAA